MKCHQTEQSTRGCSAAGYTYPNGRLLPSCFGLVKFSGFRYAKTSANKRFLIICLPSQYDFAAAKVQKNADICKFLFLFMYSIDVLEK